MEQTDLAGVLGQLHAQVVDQLQGGRRQVHVGLRALQQAQRAGLHRARGAGERGEREVAGFAVAQDALVGRWQPGVAEAPAEPAVRGFHQAFLGHFLDRGEQRQVQFVGRHVAGNQLEHRVAAVEAALAHQDPVIAALVVQGQSHRHAEIGQFGGKAFGFGNLDGAAFLQDLGKVQGLAEGLVGETFRAGFHQQRQGLEGGRVLAGERTGHVGVPSRTGRRVAPGASFSKATPTPTLTVCGRRTGRSFFTGSLQPRQPDTDPGVIENQKDFRIFP